MSEDKPGVGKRLWNRPGLAAMMGAVLALMGQKAFDTVFTDAKSLVLERATFPQIHARIELTRKLVSQVPCDERILAYQSIITEALQDDLLITHMKQSNAQTRSDIFTTDKWNDVPLIQLPCQP